MVRLKLTDPKLIFAATIAGGVLGGFVPVAGLTVKPIGDLYIAILSIAIVPLMMTAVISGIGKMLRSPSLRQTFPRFAIAYLLTLMIPGALAIGIGLLVEPGGGLSAEAAAQLGQRMSLATADPTPTNGLYEFLIGIVPSNIFQALTAQNFAAIVIFSVLMGVGLGVVDAPATDDTIRVIHSLYETFCRIFQWILAPLAIGLFCLMAGVAATVEAEMFISLIGFIAAFYGAGIALFIIYTLLLMGFRRVKGLGSLATLRLPLGISFLANNPFIAVRPAIDRLVKNLDVEEDVANAVLPFGVIASQHGQIINIILLTMFLANIYGVDLSAVQIATLFIGGVIGGAAAVGGGAALAPVLIPVLASVGVPGDLGIVVLATTEQIVGPMISFLTVYTASTLVLLGRGKAILATAAAIEEAVETD